MTKVKVKALTLTKSWLSVKLENKKSLKYYKVYIQKQERKWKFFIYNLWFFDNNWIYYDLLKIKYQKNPEMNT